HADANGIGSARGGFFGGFFGGQGGLESPQGGRDCPYCRGHCSFLSHVTCSMMASLLEHGLKDVAESLIHFQATIFKPELSISRRLDVGRRVQGSGTRSQGSGIRRPTDAARLLTPDF